MLNLVNGKYYGLNAVGVVIWKTLAEPASLAEIEIAIMREFEVDQETCRREALAFLDQMVGEQLLSIIDDESY